MGLTRRLVRSFTQRAAKYAGIPLRDPALVAMLGSQPTPAGVDMDEMSALSIGAVWQAVTLIADNVAAMPVTPTELMPDGSHRSLASTPEGYVLGCRPNPEMTPFVFYETLQAHCLTWGNGYGRIVRQGSDQSDLEAPLKEIWPLLPNQMRPARDPERYSGDVFYQFTAMEPGEQNEDIPANQVLHIPGLGFDGLKGYGVVQMARDSLGLAAAQEKNAGAFFGRSSIPGGVMTVPETVRLTDQSRKNLRESWELLHRGPDNAHRLALLEHGIEYKNITIPPDQAQFLQSRQFSVVEIARWFNIPPHLLRDLSNATYSNIEHQGLDFLTYTLRPWLLRWQQEMLRKLYPARLLAVRAIAHGTDNLLMNDTKARYEAYNSAHNIGLLSLNEMRAKERLNPLPPEIGDVRIMPVNVSERGVAKNAPETVASALQIAQQQKMDERQASAFFQGTLPGIADDLVKVLVALSKNAPLPTTPDPTKREAA